MKSLVIALAASAVFAVGAYAQGPAQGPAPAAPAKAKYSTASTPLVDLLNNPLTKAIVAKALSPDALKQIDAEFAKL